MLKATSCLKERAKKTIANLKRTGKSEENMDNPEGFLVTVGLKKEKGYMPVDTINDNGVEYVICHRTK